MRLLGSSVFWYSCDPRPTTADSDSPAATQSPFEQLRCWHAASCAPRAGDVKPLRAGWQASAECTKLRFSAEGAVSCPCDALQGLHAVVPQPHGLQQAPSVERKRSTGAPTDPHLGLLSANRPSQPQIGAAAHLVYDLALLVPFSGLTVHGQPPHLRPAPSPRARSCGMASGRACLRRFVLVPRQSFRSCPATSM